MNYTTIKNRIKEIENLELYIQRLSNPRCILCFTLPDESTLPINEAFINTFIGKGRLSFKEIYIENANQHLQLLITNLEQDTKHPLN